MSDTPRTDEESLRACGGKLICVHTDFARQLERELTAMTIIAEKCRVRELEQLKQLEEKN